MKFVKICTMRIEIFLFSFILLFYPLITSASIMESPGEEQGRKKNHAGETFNEWKTYKVKKGDTLYSISKKTGLSVEKLRRLNRINKNIIKTGQVLIISDPEESLSGLSTNSQRKEPVKQPEDKISLQEEKQSEPQTPYDLTVTGQRNRLVQFALSFLNVPYKLGGTTISGVDCSGLVWTVFNSSGIEVPRTVRGLFFSGRPVEKEEMLPGDILFFYIRKLSEPDHAGIYIGENRFIHASRRLKKVMISELDSPYYLKRFMGARRFLE